MMLLQTHSENHRMFSAPDADWFYTHIMMIVTSMRLSLEQLDSQEVGSQLGIQDVQCLQCYCNVCQSLYLFQR